MIYICTDKLNALLQNALLKQNVQQSSSRADMADAALVSFKQGMLSQQQKDCNMASTVPLKQQDSHTQVTHSPAHNLYILALFAVLAFARHIMSPIVESSAARSNA